MSSEIEPTSFGPFAAPGNWYRGALHVHTTSSDGTESPEKVVQRYHECGYDFVVLTDHYCVTRCPAPEGMLVLPGIEIDCNAGPPDKYWHFVGVGIDKEPAKKFESPEDIAKFLKKRARFVTLAHPYWSQLSGEDARQFADCDAMEVRNTVCQLLDSRGSAEQPWDYVLSSGARLNAVAVDDTHQKPNDLGRGWVMVKAGELSPDAIYAALKNGHFYSSTGPEIHDWNRFDDAIRVQTGPCRTISFMCNTWYGGRFDAEPDRTFAEAAYPLQGPEIYLRVQVTDAEGKRAWTNPIYF